MPVGAFQIFFYVLCLILVWLSLRGLLGGRAIFEFPTIAAMLGLAWIVPQGIKLGSSPLDMFGSEAFWLYVSLCFLAIWGGFVAGKSTHFRKNQKFPGADFPRYSVKRLLIAAVCLTSIGQIAQLFMGTVDTSEMGSQWTGVITMYALLSKASGLGLCLSVLIFAHTRSRIALLIALISALPLFTTAFFGIRREQIFDLFVLSFGSWYVARARSPSPLIVASCLLIGALILNSAGNLREYVASEGGTLAGAMISEEVYHEFDYADLSQGSSSEIGQAQYDFWSMNQGWEWEFGAEYINAMTQQYVPAFLLGRTFKDSLRIDTLSERINRGKSDGMLVFGATRTGFSDSYRSFGVFGAFVFGIIGFIFGLLYARSQGGGISSQYYYFVLLAEGLKSVTHSTSEFFAALPFVLVISSMGFWFARMPTRPRGASHKAKAALLFDRVEQ